MPFVVLVPPCFIIIIFLMQHLRYISSKMIFNFGESTVLKLIVPQISLTLLIVMSR